MESEAVILISPALGVRFKLLACGAEVRIDLLQVIAPDGPIRHTAIEAECRHLSDAIADGIHAEQGGHEVAGDELALGELCGVLRHVVELHQREAVAVELAVVDWDAEAAVRQVLAVHEATARPVALALLNEMHAEATDREVGQWVGDFTLADGIHQFGVPAAHLRLILDELAHLVREGFTGPT